MSKNRLMFYDKVEKMAVPLNILILGMKGAGKNTFARELKVLVPDLVVGMFDDLGTNAAINVLIDLPDQEHVEIGLSSGEITHTFWVDSGERVEREEAYAYEPTFDPHRMILVDNSGNMNNLKFEASLCVQLMDLLDEA